MVVTNGLTNYPGVHKCSFKFTSGEYSWGTENFFLRVFDGQDSNQELTDDPPSVLVPSNVVTQILTDLEELKLATKMGRLLFLRRRKRI